MQFIELMATISGLLCVYFGIRQNILTWLFGLIQVVIYTYIFYEAALYSDVGLHVFYIFIQLYGYYSWTKKDENNQTLQPGLIGQWVYLWIILVVGSSFVLGSFMSTYTSASMAFPDAFTTTSSILAQFLMIRKKVESWIFWIVVNLYAIIIYASKGLLISSGLYFVFLFMAIIGLIEWNRAFLQKQKTYGAKEI